MLTRRAAAVVWVSCTALAAIVPAASCKPIDQDERGKKVLHVGLRGHPGSLDPLANDSQFAMQAIAPVYESLLDYAYAEVPYRLVPGLLERMPEVSEDLETYTFTLRRSVRFHDDPCFPDGKGREMHAADAIDSIKRMADRDRAPRGWWIYNDRIAGLDAFKAAQDARPRGAPFAADTPVEGLELIDTHRFRIHLARPYPQLLYVLATHFASVVPREAVDHYGPRIASHPVGTGPFRVKRLVPGGEIAFERHPGYRAPPGAREPSLDGLVMTPYVQGEPLWLAWRARDLDLIQVPAEYLASMFDESGALRPRFVEDGVGRHDLPLLDLVCVGFNMEDPIVGGFEGGKLVRQALSLAIDPQEINDAFYDGTNVVYDGPIPPGLDGHSNGAISPYRGPRVADARALLGKAGYPDGRGLPTLVLDTSNASVSREQGEMIARQLQTIGVRLEVRLNSFPELTDKLRRKKAQLFRFAWLSDYPDAENNLAVFYGPNSSPGSNTFNYRNSEYDTLYEQSRTLLPTPERTRVYERMRDIVIEDVPFAGGMARTRFYAWNRRVKGAVPAEVWWRWLNRLEVEPR